MSKEYEVFVLVRDIVGAGSLRDAGEKLSDLLRGAPKSERVGNRTFTDAYSSFRCAEPPKWTALPNGDLRLEVTFTDNDTLAGYSERDYIHVAICALLNRYYNAPKVKGRQSWETDSEGRKWEREK